MTMSYITKNRMIQNIVFRSNTEKTAKYQYFVFVIKYTQI